MKVSVLSSVRVRPLRRGVAQVRVVLASTSLVSTLWLGACGGDSPTPLAPGNRGPLSATSAAPTVKAPEATTSPAVPALPFDVDPVTVALGRTTPGAGGAEDIARAREGVVALCDGSLARASLTLDELRGRDGKPNGELTWDTTVGSLDLARGALRNAADFPSLLAVAHPDEGVREQAKGCEPKVDKLETSLWLDAAIARVIKRYAAKNEPLSGPRAKLLAEVVRDFRRNGLDLDANGQRRIRAINEAVTKLGQDFDSNLAASHLEVEATPSQLQGLPKEWLASHSPGANGKITITTDYPDYFPVLTYATNRKLALELYKQFENRAANTNVEVLDKILALRAEKAKLLGYATWADYVTEPRMAKNAKQVAHFLDGLKRHIAKKAQTEFAEFRAVHVAQGGKANDPIPPSDRPYLEDQVRKATYGLDSKEVSQYLEVRKVKQGILAITSKMYGITYRAANMPTWHADVEPMEIVAANGQVLGRFFFDLYPREGKYKHAAVFSVRDTRHMPDGSRLMPMAAIECNFPRPGASGPALMSHSDTVTFFHEFGHVLHHLLSEAELSSFAGTTVARDFVEAPSQMFEEWAWAKETLDLFALHHQTGKPMPKTLHAAMLRSRGLGRALSTQRQLFLAALDQAYHTRPLPLDTTKVLQEVGEAYTPFKYVEGTHFQASFGHLIGYDAGYYGYQWALSIAQDLFTRFKTEGLLNPRTASAYRASVLAAGSRDEEAQLVATFLGRPPSDVAYKSFLLD